MTSDEKFRKDAVQKFNFSRCSDNFVVNISTGVDPVLDTLEQERMLANFTQLHELVTETFDTCRLSLSPERISNFNPVRNETKKPTLLSLFHRQSSWTSSSACIVATATHSCVP